MPAPKENSFPKRKVQKKQRFFQTKSLVKKFLVQKSAPHPKESILPETETLPRKGKKSHFIFRHNTAHLSLSQPNESKQASTSFLEKPNNFRIPKNPPYFSRKIPKFTPKQAVHFLQKDSP
ncbi:hypothetical protein [Fibrobacter intestinalis]|uniref:hypothetical protein n=1 Tax=Fibrobacter intestinalis TaxID=28122 RepID=UPI001160B2C5|nr:hypothetical protein [Fibrobacter intestinalis]